MACGGSTATNLITEFCFVPVAMCKYKQTPLLGADNKKS